MVRGLLGVALVRPDDGWPWATFAANLAAAALLGWLTAHWAERPVRRSLHVFSTAGVCGGLSTFSTFQVEVLLLVQDGYAGLAAAYAVVSVLAGLLAVRAGAAVRRW